MRRSAAMLLLLLLCSCQPRSDKNTTKTGADSVGTETTTQGTETSARTPTAHAAAPLAGSVAAGSGVTFTFTTDAKGTVHLTGDFCRRLQHDQWLRVEPKNGAAVDQIVTVQWPDNEKTEVLAFNKNNHYLTSANPVADFKALVTPDHQARAVALKFKKGGKYLAVVRVNTAKGACKPPNPDVVVDGN